MNTVIRAHIKNADRLAGLEREIISWKDKKMDFLGELVVVDDGSSMQEEVITLCRRHDIYYALAGGTPDTKNGLYWSLKVQTAFPVFCCVDDAVFGQGITNRLKYLVEHELNKISDYGLVGTFACYEEKTRNPNKLPDADLWEIKNDILYALVGHVFSERLARLVMKEWEDVQAKRIPYPGMCDDLWVATLLRRYGIKAYNTMKDYTQHTGINNRTFGDNTGSDYISKMFVGE